MSFETVLDTKQIGEFRRAGLLNQGVGANAMMLWRFREAPGFLQLFTTHGGDEDWIIFEQHCGIDGDDMAQRMAVCTYNQCPVWVPTVQMHESEKRENNSSELYYIGTVYITCHA